MKGKDMTLTKWFPTDVKPVHIGVYEIKFHLYEDQWDQGYAYWNGKEWSNNRHTVKWAYINRDHIEGAIQEKKWRGLTEQKK
jgi:hypothetical protein